MAMLQVEPLNVYFPEVPADHRRSLITSGYRDRSLAVKLADHIREISRNKDYLIVHVCGT